MITCQICKLEFKSIISALDGIRNNELVSEIIAKRLPSLLSTDVLNVIKSVIMQDDLLHKFIVDISLKSKNLLSIMSSSTKKNSEKIKVVNGLLESHYIIYNSRLIKVSSSEIINELDA